MRVACLFPPRLPCGGCAFRGSIGCDLVCDHARGPKQRMWVLKGRREDDGLRCERGFAHACTRSLLRWSSALGQTARVEFLVEAAKAFLSSWYGQVHGVLRVAGTGPIETTDTERMVFFSVSDLQETSLLELLLAAPCLVDRLNTYFGYLPQFIWILGPLLERALLSVDSLITPSSRWTLSALQSAAVTSNHERPQDVHAYVEASQVRFRTCSASLVAVDDSRVGRALETWCSAGPCHQLRSMLVATGDRVKQHFLHPTVTHCSVVCGTCQTFST